MERKSPLLKKLDEIGFNSPDFIDQSKRSFDLLLKNTPTHELGPCTKKQLKRIEKSRKKESRTQQLELKGQD